MRKEVLGPTTVNVGNVFQWVDRPVYVLRVHTDTSLSLTEEDATAAATQTHTILVAMSHRHMIYVTRANAAQDKCAGDRQ